MKRSKSGLALARLSKKAASAKVDKPKKPRKSPIKSPSRRKFLKAIIGTGGVKKLIAERLGCSYETVRRCLEREDWEDVRWAVQDEMDKVADLAEETIALTIKQRLDLNLASQNARWLLTRARHKDRKMGDESKVTVEGGDRPLRLQQSVQMSLDTIDLPIEVKRSILEAMEKEKKHEETKDAKE